MNCNMTERVSLLIDGALSDTEAAEARGHISMCAECRKAMEDFIHLRDTLQDYDSVPEDLAQRRALNIIMATKRTPLWGRSVPVPVPLLVFLIVALVALAAWSFSAPWRRAALPVTAALPANGDAGEQPAGALAAELQRFDHGGRAVIVKALRRRSDEGQLPRSDVK